MKKSLGLGITLAFFLFGLTVAQEPSTGITILSVNPFTIDEIIVLKNTTDQTIELTGWSLSVNRAGRSSQHYGFPEGCELPAGATLRLHSGPANLTRSDTDCNQEQIDLVWNASFVLPNEAGIVTLRDAEDSIVSQFKYPKLTVEQREQLVGRWEGYIRVARERVLVQVDFGVANDELVATLNIAQLAIEHLAISDVRFHEQRVHFESQAARFVFDGELKGESISGKLYREGVLTALRLQRVPILEISPTSLVGHWEGAISISGTSLNFSVDFQIDDAVLKATIDIPQQGVQTLPLSNIRLESGRVRFEISQAGAVFDGALEDDTIKGDFRQGAFEGTFELNRTIAEATTPDEPETAPLPYREEEVSFQNGDITLAGTLTLPDAAGPHPTAIMITGSGAQNRDEEVFGFKIFGIIADHLTRNGIAVLRYDDRGVGGSSGDLFQSTLGDLAGDVLAAIELLKAHPEIDSEQIGLIGHSEGGMVGPLAVVQSEDVSFMVLIASLGTTGEELLLAQSELILRVNGASEVQIETQQQLQRMIFAAIRTGEGWEGVEEAIRQQVQDNISNLPEDQRQSFSDADVETIVTQQIQAVQTPWYMSFMEYDPKPLLEQTTMPVLAIFGGLDLQVPAESNLEGMKLFFEVAGNEAVVFKVFPEANHLFQVAITGNPNEYETLEKTFVPGFLELITDWITGLVAIGAEAD